MATQPRTTPVRVASGLALERPVIDARNLVAFGDEYFATDTGEYNHATSTSAGAVQWTTSASGAGTARGKGTLAGGTLVVTPGVVVTVGSTVILQRIGTNAFTMGDLVVSAQTPGAAGIGTFTVTAEALAGGATVGTDVSAFNWLIIG